MDDRSDSSRLEYVVDELEAENQRLTAENERLERQYKGASLYADEITERNNRLHAKIGRLEAMVWRLLGR